MNQKLSMAVAGAVLAFGASAANAGITIPAGDWTIDIGGNANAYYTYAKESGSATVTGGLAAGGTAKNSNVRTGLLPSAIGFGGKTRQNDLDIAFQFTFFVGDDDNNGGAALGSNSINIRQSFLSFGDASWGTIKGGRDLGIYGSDAILSDMTLLGVGGGASGKGGSSTLGHIGTGYVYADWVGQISYASPNWNGFSFAVGVRDPWSDTNAANTAQKDAGFEGKVSYAWDGDFAGKAWLGGITQKVQSAGGSAVSSRGQGWEIGAKAGAVGFEGVAYYYAGEGLGTTGYLLNGFTATGARRDGDGYFVQGTYKIPTIGTKVGVSYGESNLDKASGEVNATLLKTNSLWTVGVYHPLTKSLNLVAEYNKLESENQSGATNNSKSVSLGAILFF